MLPRRAFVDHAGLSHLGLEGLKLRISTGGLWSVNNTDLTGLHFGVKTLEQVGRPTL